MNSKKVTIVEQFFNLPPRTGAPNNSDDGSKPGGLALLSSDDRGIGENPSVSTELVWQWLSEIPDPEIPVISLVDLGIIRHIAWHGGLLVITVTPTYTGCPATRVIQSDIELYLRQRGIRQSKIERQLSPPWTTDWISDHGRSQLRQYGIAPPQADVSGSDSSGPGARVFCPRCQSDNTQRVSQFGSTPCKASYRCEDCLEPFEYFKCL